MHRAKHKLSSSDDEHVKAHSKKDTVRWCKGVEGREHVKEWLQRAESYLHDWQTLTCLNCGKTFDSRWPCRECGQFKCGGHREPFIRQHRKYPRQMSASFRQGTGYRKQRDS